MEKVEVVIGKWIFIEATIARGVVLYVMGSSVSCTIWQNMLPCVQG